MTPELSGYNPDQAPQSDPNRSGLVFLDHYDREHDIDTEPATPVAPPSVEEETHAVDAAYEQEVLDRQRAAAEQREAKANDEQCRYAIECNTIAMANIQDYSAVHGLDPAHEGLTQNDFDLAGY